MEEAEREEQKEGDLMAISCCDDENEEEEEDRFAAEVVDGSEVELGEGADGEVVLMMSW